MKVIQLYLTFSDPMDYTVHGILQVRILEWVAVPFSRGSSQPRDQTQVSHIAGGSLPAEPQGKPFDAFTMPLFSLVQSIVLEIKLLLNKKLHKIINLEYILMHCGASLVTQMVKEFVMWETWV